LPISSVAPIDAGNFRFSCLNRASHAWSRYVFREMPINAVDGASFGDNLKSDCQRGNPHPLNTDTARSPATETR
jgi:hypothetical protein